MHKPYVVALGVALLASATAMPAAGADGGGRVGTRSLTLHATSTNAGPIVQHPPVCDAGGQCIGSYSSSNTVSGDLVGTVAVEGLVRLVLGDPLVRQANLQLFDVAVAGCGSGTFVVELPFQPLSLVAPSTGRASIVAGSGTGDLAGIRGTVDETFTPDPAGGGTGGFTFKVRCRAR